MERYPRSKWQSYRQKTKRADEIRKAEIEAEAEDKKRADEIKIQTAKTETDKELTLKEM